MKGKELCYTFLKSGKKPSDLQEELPSKLVDREAMFLIMWELYQELSALKPEAQILLQKETSETSEATPSAIGTSTPEQRESDAIDAFFDATESGENMNEPPLERPAQNTAGTPPAATLQEKFERQKISAMPILHSYSVPDQEWSGFAVRIC